MPTEIHQQYGSVYTSKLGKDNAQICCEIQAIYPAHLHLSDENINGEMRP